MWTHENRAKTLGNTSDRRIPSRGSRVTLHTVESRRTTVVDDLKAMALHLRGGMCGYEAGKAELASASRKARTGVTLPCCLDDLTDFTQAKGNNLLLLLGRRGNVSSADREIQLI